MLIQREEWLTQQYKKKRVIKQQIDIIHIHFVVANAFSFEQFCIGHFFRTKNEIIQEWILYTSSMMKKGI